MSKHRVRFAEFLVPGRPDGCPQSTVTRPQSPAIRLDDDNGRAARAWCRVLKRTVKLTAFVVVLFTKRFFYRQIRRTSAVSRRSWSSPYLPMSFGEFSRTFIFYFFSVKITRPIRRGGKNGMVRGNVICVHDRRRRTHVRRSCTCDDGLTARARLWSLTDDAILP